MRLRHVVGPVIAVGASALVVSATPAVSHAAGSVSGAATVHQLGVKAAHAASTASGNLYYHGGTGGVGVEAAYSPTPFQEVYLVFWGTQWTNNDPSGEASIQENFFAGVGGSSWNNSVTQYCEGVPTGTYFCNGAGEAATNNAGLFGGYWYDNASSAPKHPSQSQLASEAVRAAGYFGKKSASANATVQYVIATAHGNNSRGFGTQYCAWHSSTTSTYGNIAYTNMPYITDAGSSCGANFNGLGADAGITIVGGHEFGETETDIFPSSGWLDSGGSENGDKCAWITTGGQGAAANVTLMNGKVFPVQSLWSNAFNGNAGGCVLSYP